MKSDTDCAASGFTRGFPPNGFPDGNRQDKKIFHSLYKKRIAELAAERETAGAQTEPPALLLHSCCGPCSSAVITKLAPFFKLTVFYYNPNIDTAAEYRRRADTQKQLIAAMQAEAELPFPVSYLEADFDSAPFYRASAGLEREKEGGRRCAACFRLRLEKTASEAARLGFRFFCSTLSVSPMKNAPLINRIGAEAGETYGCEWLFSDFKKEDGYLLSINLSKRFDLYRQTYCGCVFSKAEAEAHRPQETE